MVNEGENLLAAAPGRRGRRLWLWWALSVLLAAGLAGGGVFLFFSLAKGKSPASMPHLSFLTDRPTPVLARLQEVPLDEVESLVREPDIEAETAVYAVLSASQIPPDEMSGVEEIGAVVLEEAPEDTGEGREDWLLEIVTSEARLVTKRLAKENQDLRADLDEERRRVRKLSEALAHAQARLDDRESQRALDAGAISTHRRDVPVEASVLDVNPELGVVILSQGARQGVRYGLPLVVTRDQRKVATVRVVDVREHVSGAVVVETERREYPQAGDRAVLMRTAEPKGNKNYGN